MIDYLERASTLIKSYIPPEVSMIQASRQANHASVNLAGTGKGLEFTFKDYLKSGDALSIDLNLQKEEVTGLHVDSYLDNPKDTVTMDVTFATLPDGTSYPRQSIMNTKKKDISVNVENSGYRKMK